MSPIHLTQRGQGITNKHFTVHLGHLRAKAWVDTNRPLSVHLGDLGATAWGFIKQLRLGVSHRAW